MPKEHSVTRGLELSDPPRAPVGGEGAEVESVTGGQRLNQLCLWHEACIKPPKDRVEELLGWGHEEVQGEGPLGEGLGPHPPAPHPLRLSTRLSLRSVLFPQTGV